MTSMLEVPVGGYLRVVAVVVRYRDQSVRPRLRTKAKGTNILGHVKTVIKVCRPNKVES